MAKTYEPIATTTIGSAVTTFSFTSIPSIYTDLFIVIEGPGISGGTSMDSNIRFNSDTGSNYSDTRVQNIYSDRSSNATAIRTGAPRSNNRWNTAIHISNYADTSFYKTIISRSNALGSDSLAEMYSGSWRSTAAISSFTMVSGQSRNYEVGTTCTVYGIKCE
jgi:hypothetical protein